MVGSGGDSCQQFDRVGIKDVGAGRRRLFPTRRCGRLGLEQRRCLICADTARNCILLQHHSTAELKAKIDELLAPFRA